MTNSIFKLGALGDSISVAHNADAIGTNAHHSWTTGGEHSHLGRIQTRFPHLKVIPLNVAVSGARSSDLKIQVDQLIPHRPDYVTLMIGANDLSEWFMSRQTHKILDFTQNVRQAVTRLIEVNPRTMILQVAIPDQSRVLTLLANQRMIGKYEAVLNNLMQSPELQAMTSFYKGLQRQANTALREIAQEFSKNVRYAGSVASAIFSEAHLSKHDFYHPSVLGQRLLADLTWQDGFFP